MGFWKSGLMLINLHFIGESFISGQNIISSIPFFRPGKYWKDSEYAILINWLFLVMEIVNNISSAIFVIVRMISLALTVMTFHLGFAHQPEVDWNTSKTRIFALCVVSLVQVIESLSKSWFNILILRSIKCGYFWVIASKNGVNINAQSVIRLLQFCHVFICLISSFKFPFYLFFAIELQPFHFILPDCVTILFLRINFFNWYFMSCWF